MYHLQGLNVDWAYLKKLHPTIPVIQVVLKHVEDQFWLWTQYSWHTHPDNMKGLLKLQQMYKAEELHTKDHTGHKLYWNAQFSAGKFV